jgi:hypothetical protein
MQARPRLRPWLAVSLLLVSSRAAAVDKLQGIGQASLGFTDNVHSSPDEPVEDMPERSADMFLVLSPSLVFARLTPDQSQTLKYTFAANLFFDTFRASSFANRLEWLGHFTTSRRTELLLGAGISQQQPYTSPTLADAGSQTLRATIPTTNSYVAVRADETLSIDLGPFWRAWQGASAGMQTPIDPALVDDLPTTYEAGGRLGTEHIWLDNALGPEVRSRYALIRNAVGRPPARGEPPARLGNLSQLINEYVGIWRHDWSRYVTSRLEGGAVHVIPLSRDGELWHPAARASLGYARDEGRVEISYTHTVRTNLLLGQLVLIDEVALHGAIPLDRDDELWLSSSIGYQKGKLLGPSGELETRVDVALGDVALAWQVQDHVTLAGRFQHITQTTDAEAPPLPLSYDRNTVMATVTFKWPPDREMPRRYRPPERVDRQDELGGEEPDSAPIPGQRR